METKKKKKNYVIGLGGGKTERDIQRERWKRY